MSSWKQLRECSVTDKHTPENKRLNWYLILRRYEDHRALDGGDDGMTLIRDILRGSQFIVKDGG